MDFITLLPPTAHKHRSKSWEHADRMASYVVDTESLGLRFSTLANGVELTYCLQYYAYFSTMTLTNDSETRKGETC